MTSPIAKQSLLSLILDRIYQGDWTTFSRDWESWRLTPKLTVIFTPNPEQVIQAKQSAAFLTVLLSADILLPDGTGIVWACRRLQPNKKCGRLAGREVVEWWLEEASQRQIKTLLLGSRPGVAEALARQVDPHETWCIASGGYQDVRQPTKEEESAVRELIQTKQPEVVLVAFGAPWQETWISEHRDLLENNGVKLAMVCGGALDILSPASALKAPPPLIQQLNLEWLYRLIKEPRRWRRQLRLIQFIGLVMAEVMAEKLKTNDQTI